MGQTIAKDGTIALPQQVRETLGVGPGSVVEFFNDGGRIVLRRAQDRHVETLPGEIELSVRLASLRGIAPDGEAADDFMRALRGRDEDDPGFDFDKSGTGKAAE